jgi:hypothetical protein
VIEEDLVAMTGSHDSESTLLHSPQSWVIPFLSKYHPLGALAMTATFTNSRFVPRAPQYIGIFLYLLLTYNAFFWELLED